MFQLPWKTLKNVIEYYYMWKTTDRYVQQKRVKAVEAESKLKQVYIPNYNKTTPPTTVPSAATIVPLGNSNSNSNGKPTNVLNGNSNGNMTTDNSGILMVGVSGKPCESCQVMQSPQWYAWGPSHMQCRLCQSCWTYWKKYGGLKVYFNGYTYISNDNHIMHENILSFFSLFSCPPLQKKLFPFRFHRVWTMLIWKEKEVVPVPMKKAKE